MASVESEYRSSRRSLRAEASPPSSKTLPHNLGNPDYGSGTDNFDSAQCLVAKVVMLGHTGVGKSSIVTRYVEGTFANIKSTVGASFFTKRFTVDGMRVKLQIWDTAGQERFRSLAPMFYRGAAAAVIVFDVTDDYSFEQLKGWVDELKKNSDPSLVMAIAANKTDLSEQRRIPPSVVCEYASTINAAIFDTSAKNNTGIDDMFHSIAKHLVGAHQSFQSPVASPYLGTTPEPPPEPKSCC